jgi:hypothetical protein
VKERVKEKEREMNLLILCCCFQRGLCCLGELANPSLVPWFKILNLFSMLLTMGKYPIFLTLNQGL